MSSGAQSSSAFIGFDWQVILTADTPVLDNPGGIIFTSTDAGATFKFIQLRFHLAQPITYHFLNPDYLVAVSIDVGLSFFFFSQALTVVSLALCSILDQNFAHAHAHTSNTHLKVKVNTPLFPPDMQGGLWLSLDFGATWTKVHDGVHSFSWWE